MYGLVLCLLKAKRLGSVELVCERNCLLEKLCECLMMKFHIGLVRRHKLTWGFKCYAFNPFAEAF